MTEREEDEDFSHLWLGSSKLHAFILVLSIVCLAGPLSSSAPLIAVFFPGVFIASSAWALLSDRRMWSPVRQPVRTYAPAALYMVAATVILFAAHASTGRDIYRSAAMGSLWLTIPAAVLTVFIVVFRGRSVRTTT